MFSVMNSGLSCRTVTFCKGRGQTVGPQQQRPLQSSSCPWMVFALWILHLPSLAQHVGSPCSSLIHLILSLWVSESEEVHSLSLIPSQKLLLRSAEWSHGSDRSGFLLLRRAWCWSENLCKSAQQETR